MNHAKPFSHSVWKSLSKVFFLQQCEQRFRNIFEFSRQKSSFELTTLGANSYIWINNFVHLKKKLKWDIFDNFQTLCISRFLQGNFEVWKSLRRNCCWRMIIYFYANSVFLFDRFFCISNESFSVNMWFAARPLNLKKIRL